MPYVPLALLLQVLRGSSYIFMEVKIIIITTIARHYYYWLNLPHRLLARCMLIYIGAPMAAVELWRRQADSKKMENIIGI